jgi:hypothetical protein
MELMKEYDSVKDGSTIHTDLRLLLLECIRDPGKITVKKVKRQVLLKCLGEEQAKVAVREVHDGICGAHQSAYKMNWLLQRSGFYWPTMMDDCVKYQKGCEEC